MLKHINASLISLKCVICLFFGGLGALLPFLPVHMAKLGLSAEEIRIIAIVAPCVAILGPLVAGPLADRLAGSGAGSGSRSNSRGSGKYLRVMIAACMLLSVIFYWLLMLVPSIERSPPNVTFSCDDSGGVVIQQRCGADKTCYNWDANKRGSLLVNHCRFTCDSGFETGSIYATTIDPELDVSSFSEENLLEVYDEYDIVDDETDAPLNKNPSGTEVTPHPHLCYKNVDGFDICEVYTKYSKPINLNINLSPTIDEGNVEDKDELGECRYALGSNFHCRIPQDVVLNLTRRNANNNNHNNTCHPAIQCLLHDPYGSSTPSMLRVSECGYANASFWVYLIIRCIADAFPAATVALLAAACVIATRETSEGRGDVGRQMACGALGMAITAPIVGACESQVVALGVFTGCLLVAVVVMLLDSKMPLSPPEWWWHTRCGLVAYPMSAVRKYGMETIALTIILIALGVFWGILDSLFPWRLLATQGGALIIGLSITVGALPAIPFLIFAEKIADYCGHTNILITAFIMYILQFTGASYIEQPGLLLLCEALEIFTLYILWITAILYLRHLVPRRFTASGQAIPVIAHFCLGRVIGLCCYSVEAIGGGGGGRMSNLRDNYYVHAAIHRECAVAAAVLACLYIVVYHGYLKPRYAAPVAEPQERQTPSIVQNMNGNGSYTPLRVYHNGRAKKGQFRY